MKIIISLWKKMTYIIGTFCMLCGIALFGFLAFVYVFDKIEDIKNSLVRRNRKDKYYETYC